eukprot:3200379-Amphidinium_carterae.1
MSAGDKIVPGVGIFTVWRLPYSGPFWIITKYKYHPTAIHFKINFPNGPNPQTGKNDRTEFPTT